MEYIFSIDPNCPALAKSAQEYDEAAICGRLAYAERRVSYKVSPKVDDLVAARCRVSHRETIASDNGERDCLISGSPRLIHRTKEI